MKRRHITLAVFALLAGFSAALAEPMKSEYPDYDDDLMKDLERTIKYFEPDVTGGNDTGIADDIAVLTQGFQYTEKYFAKRGKAPDAVKISQDGLKALGAVQKFLADKNTDAAAASAREVTDACKSCHDVYKPKQARG